jgi:uncharacterized membrane protein
MSHVRNLVRRPLSQGACIALGAGIGAAIGNAIGNAAVGIGVGIAIGAAIGATLSGSGGAKPRSDSPGLNARDGLSSEERKT